MSAPADSAEERWLARLRERRREGALHVAALEDVEALIAERDEALSQVKAWQAEELARRTERDDARAEVELLKDHAAGTLCIRCDLLQVERDEARAEVERLKAEVGILRGGTK